MSILHSSILKLWLASCLCAIGITPCLYAQAQFASGAVYAYAHSQFTPGHGIRSTRWKVPQVHLTQNNRIRGVSIAYDLDSFYWPNDKELVFMAILQPQYFQRNLRSGKEHSLDGFTNLVGRNEIEQRGLPYLFPSPDRKYVAWIAKTNTLMISTVSGAIISQQSYPTPILYPSWSEDSQECFCFVEGEVPDLSGGNILISDIKAFTTISVVEISKPTVVSAFSVEGGPLTGHVGTLLIPGGAFDFWVPDFHFGNHNHIVVIRQVDGQGFKPTTIVRLDEFNLADATKPLGTHIVKMPASLQFAKAEFSPQGDKIAWILDSADNDIEIWISDQTGEQMVRLGSYPHRKPAPGGKDHYFAMKWLPSGKGISLREAGELYVVTVPVHNQANIGGTL